VFGCSLCNWLLDVACLVLVIRATGSPVPWHGVLLAYGAGLVADSLWPAPGGFGAVEAAMAASLVAAGMHAGTALAAVAVYRLLGSSFAVGMVSLAQLGPLLVGSLLGGSIADAFDRRKVLLGSQLALAGCSAGLALNATGGHPALWPLFAFPAVSAGLSGLDASTRTAAMVALVDAEALVSANALRQLLLTVSLVTGPAAAGLILARFGAVAVYWIDVASFAAAMVAVLGLPSLRPAGGGTRAGLTSMVEGLR